VRAKAEGGSFLPWLLGSLTRDDVVGDLASDAQRDAAVEEGACWGWSYWDWYKYVRRKSQQSEQVVDALQKAWLEYWTKYPMRRSLRVGCDVCNDVIELTELDSAIIHLATGRVSHVRCTSDHGTCVTLDVIEASGVHFIKELLLDILKAFGKGERFHQRVCNHLLCFGFPENSADTQTIYVVQASEVGNVKIGYTTQLKKRLSTLRTHSPVELTVVKQYTGPKALERYLHTIFDAFRLHGEWFSSCVLEDMDRVVGEFWGEGDQ